MATLIGPNPPARQEVADAFQNTASFRIVTEPPVSASYGRFDHGGITVSLLTVSVEDAASVQEKLERVARTGPGTGAYIDLLLTGPAAAAILATRGGADNDRILATAFPGRGPEPEPER